MNEQIRDRLWKSFEFKGFLYFAQLKTLVRLIRLDDSTGRSLIASWMSGDSLKYKQLILNELSQITDGSKYEFLRDQLTRCATDPTLPAETQAQAKALVEKIKGDPR